MVDLRVILTQEQVEPEWLVADMLYQGQMVCIAGAPGVGKSFLMYYLALCIALNIPFLGKQVTQGRVLYFDEENSLPDLRQYLQWLWHGLGAPDIEQLIANISIEHFSLATKTQGRFKYMQERASEFKPSLIVIDTVTSVCGIKDENDNAEASQVIAKLRLIKTAAGLNTTMIPLKHEKFSHDTTEQRTIRGAKTWLGEVDMVLYHIAQVGRPRKDGLRPSKIVPDKVRAFGLKSELEIFPVKNERGITLFSKNPIG